VQPHANIQNIPSVFDVQPHANIQILQVSPEAEQPLQCGCAFPLA